MIIDVHNHPDWCGHNLDKFLQNMDQYGIDKTWLLSWEIPHSDYDPRYLISCAPNDGHYGPIPFARCLNYIERCPDRFILGYAPDPKRPDAIHVMQSAIENYGVKVYGELKSRMQFDDPDGLRMYRFLANYKIPVLVHIDYEFPYSWNYPRPNYWYGGGIEALERALIACPETNFIGHAPGFWSHISGDDQYDKVAYPSGKVVEGGKLVEMLRKYPNLYCDISAGSGCNAFTRDPEFAVKFLTEFQDRVMYGRDYFDNIHQEFLNSSGLSKEILDKIYYKNACKLVPID